MGIEDRLAKAGNLHPADYPLIFELSEVLGRPFLIYDTETSGFLNQPWAEILEFAYLVFDVRDGVDEILYDGFLVRNTNPIPEETIAINGIDESMCVDGRHWPEAWAEIAGIFGRAVVSGFNSREYDSPMIRKMQTMHGGQPCVFDELDVRDIHRGLTGLRKGKLSDLCEANGVPVIDAHQAMADVIMTAGLLHRYIENLGVEKVARYRRGPATRIAQKQNSMRPGF